MPTSGVLAGLGATVLIIGLSWWRDCVMERREIEGRCAYCPTPIDPSAAFRVEGRLVCEQCAARLRRRVTAAFAGIGVLILLVLALASWIVIEALITGTSDWRFGFVFAGSTTAGLSTIALFAWRSMRNANRDADQLAALREGIVLPPSQRYDSNDERGSSADA